MLELFLEFITISILFLIKYEENGNDSCAVWPNECEHQADTRYIQCKFKFILKQWQNFITIVMNKLCIVSLR